MGRSELEVSSSSSIPNSKHSSSNSSVVYLKSCQSQVKQVGVNILLAQSFIELRFVYTDGRHIEVFRKCSRMRKVFFSSCEQLVVRKMLVLEG